MNLSVAALLAFLSIAAPLYGQGPGKHDIGVSGGRFHAGAALVADRTPDLTDQWELTWPLAFGADLTERIGLRVVFEAPRQARGFEDTFTQPSVPLPTRVTLREIRSTEAAVHQPPAGAP